MEDTTTTSRYLVACSSEGIVYVWDLCRLHRRKIRRSSRDGFEKTKDAIAKKRRMDVTIDHEPVLRFKVCEGVLYDIKFIESGSSSSSSSSSCVGGGTVTTITGDDNKFHNSQQTQQLLVTCGDNGVFLFRWSDILQRLLDITSIPPPLVSSSITDGGNDLNRHHHSRKNCTDGCGITKTIHKDLKPIRILTPHPTTHTGCSSPSSSTEINVISYDPSLDRLYGAAGDLYGGYVWDINSGKLIGTLGGDGLGVGSSLSRRHGPPTRRSRSRGGHSNYLHTIATVPITTIISTSSSNSTNHMLLTGGEDGKIGIWDSNRLVLRHMIDCKAVLISMNNGVVTSANDGDGVDTVGADTSSTAPIIHEHDSCWVSSIDVDPLGHWAILGGGINRHVTTTNDYHNNNNNNPPHRGFLASLHLPTHTITTAITTRESIQDVSYHPTEGKIISVGNEGMVSYWNRSDLGKGRIGKAWLTTPSAYCTTFSDGGDDSSGMHVAIGGVGRSVDCILGIATRFSLTF